jgi:alkylhydroperoxidase/carboxymuconolactone decarboxylase family protein YurZ
MVLRCDDCIKYHLGKSHELGVTTEQMYEIFAVANIVGGTIVIPHTRRAAEYWEELQNVEQMNKEYRMSKLGGRSKLITSLF